ncbi:TIGR03557 family F420-dependent LLM class oxidoreductase [Nocardia sp. CDC159]|uniref:TIGR03557 family F420-dependent LLM class oxidoreductase n=1 Tax=Nocardia pulmonis TaxID=2951408 RepID=A0A9X2EBT8_9NOCA|nr:MULTISPECIES: TIGR03557 family F420-dependent LLM class oxidoreductase [Nocardia]MCM6776313.1 TIGR03557 family F420-dependent LLM class oxidoreductase [Nocardia pulmonis]MCM6788737.1 TIGR03557 family F420-dependent LLM class oxidoreductase [Nocardia sp. CDC159]
MTSIGYFLASEQFGPNELVEQAKRAEQAGFQRLWISDHFHPWNDAQGNSPFVWGVIGALSQAVSLPITTAVTCPIMRIHPAIIAQAAATAFLQTEGRFCLGVGSGEALNEHIFGDPWPPAPIRLEMLEEAVGLIRKLLGGKTVDHDGKYYEVQQARIYTCPDEPVPIYVSGFGPVATELAGRIGDGYCTAMPDADLVRLFRDSGGGDKPVQAGTKVCWDRDEDTALDTAHRLWANELLPGQLGQTLPRPKDFQDAMSLVPKERTRARFAVGPDPERHIRQVRQFADAGIDEIYVQQIGPDMDGFFQTYEKEVLPVFH